jgi:hypothetical protein
MRTEGGGAFEMHTVNKIGAPKGCLAQIGAPPARPPAGRRPITVKTAVISVAGSGRGGLVSDCGVDCDGAGIVAGVSGSSCHFARSRTDAVDVSITVQYRPDTGSAGDWWFRRRRLHSLHSGGERTWATTSMARRSSV